MNKYRIAYSYDPESTSPDYIDVIERSEATARKDFKMRHKDVTIIDINLVAESVSATKQQERDTLADIRKGAQDRI